MSVANKTIQMLPQRILTRRLPQVTARFAAPRAPFSQGRRLAAAEAESSLQVQSAVNA